MSLLVTSKEHVWMDAHPDHPCTRKIKLAYQYYNTHPHDPDRGKKLEEAMEEFRVKVRINYDNDDERNEASEYVP